MEHERIIITYDIKRMCKVLVYISLAEGTLRVPARYAALRAFKYNWYLIFNCFKMFLKFQIFEIFDIFDIFVGVENLIFWKF